MKLTPLFLTTCLLSLSVTVLAAPPPVKEPNPIAIGGGRVVRIAGVRVGPATPGATISLDLDVANQLQGAASVQLTWRLGSTFAWSSRLDIGPQATSSYHVASVALPATCHPTDLWTVSLTPLDGTPSVDVTPRTIQQTATCTYVAVPRAFTALHDPSGGRVYFEDARVMLTTDGSDIVKELTCASRFRATGMLRNTSGQHASVRLFLGGPTAAATVELKPGASVPFTALGPRYEGQGGAVTLTLATQPGGPPIETGGGPIASIEFTRSCSSVGLSLR